MVIGLNETIAAIASPAGPAERGIIRISGAEAVQFAAMVFSPFEAGSDWTRSTSALRLEGQVNISSLPVPMPAALMVWPTTRSFTGQPMAEIHTLGSPPLLDAVLEQLTECGVRLANRGEFTMRAFLAGRMDLVQAEAVLGVIDATDHHELETALSQLGGGITHRLAVIRGQLLAILGDLEAGLDFVEEDIEFISADQIIDRLQNCLTILEELTHDSVDRLPSGYRPKVVLAGLPNAGKSTLFNRMIGTQKAIVSSIAGTTRDYLTSTTVCDGLEIELIDTAGWEAASDLIMQNAQQLRTDQIDRCDLVVWCMSADLSADASVISNTLLQKILDADVPVVQVRTRSDLTPSQPPVSSNSADMQPNQTIRIRRDDDSGVDTLKNVIRQQLSARSTETSELLFTTAARCRSALYQTSSYINAAIHMTETHAGDEIVSIELREALHQIGVVLGDVYTDDILDHIFSNFCIGK